MLDYEQKYYSDEIQFIVGCDEAGRGPLAGPVVAAAVILPKDYQNDIINDSKKLTEAKREALFDIIQKDALHIFVKIIDERTIDRLRRM